MIHKKYGGAEVLLIYLSHDEVMKVVELVELSESKQARAEFRSSRNCKRSMNRSVRISNSLMFFVTQ